uniref:Uncharacterized protein n=1 Tax=Oryza meridionalis TaxID=40149 RepID=A0A0E0D1Z9_9ORYZ
MGSTGFGKEQYRNSEKEICKLVLMGMEQKTADDARTETSTDVIFGKASNPPCHCPKQGKQTSIMVVTQNQTYTHPTRSSKDGNINADKSCSCWR